MEKRIILTATLALAVVLAGCGSGSRGSSDSTTAQGSSSSTPISEFRCGVLASPRLDPSATLTVATFSTVAPVEVGLTTYDKEGKAIPALAKSVENPSPTRYIYHLKKGIHFSDGSPLTAEDVIFSLKYNQRAESLTSRFLENVKAISQSGPDTVEITLEKPDVTWPGIPAFLGQVFEKAAAEKGGLKQFGTPSNMPIGAGPYKFTEFNPQVGVKMTLNPEWKGPKPAVENVDLVFIKDDSQGALAMRSGELDCDNYVETRRTFEFQGVNILPFPGVFQMAFAMNVTKAPFNDIHVRKAIAYATDQDGMIEAILDGEAEKSTTLTPLATYGNIASPGQVEAMFASQPTHAFDLEKAKAELEKSKYPQGFSVTLPITETLPTKLSQVLAADLEQIGIHVRIDEMPEGPYYEKIYGPREGLGLSFAYFGAVTPDPGTLMNFLLSPEEARDGGINLANYKDPEIARLLSEQGQETDGAKRLEQIDKIFQIMNEDVAYVPLFAPTSLFALSSKYTMDDISQWTVGYTPWPLLVHSAG
jgi:peptide/nickel transport system substrate-binding protein